LKFKILFYLSFCFLQFCAYQQPEEVEDTSLYDNLESIASSLSVSLEKHNVKTLAITNYTDSFGKENPMASYISDEITLQLFLKEAFQIIEREQIDYIINEQKLSESGLIDEKSAIEIGNILSVDAIVLGDVTEVNNNIVINTKVVSSGTGQILFMDKTSVSKNKDLDSIVADSIPPKLDRGLDINDDTKKSKSNDQSVRRLTRELLGCLRNEKFKCYNKFLANKDQFRKIILIKHAKDKRLRKLKTKNLNREFLKYKKEHKKQFLDLVSRLDKRDIDWDNIKIKKADFRIIKNYDRKKLFNVSVVLSDGKKNKHVHIGFKAFKLNGKWIINDIGLKRK
tara:strand:- start:35 stop:1051 length:1017 start_codon:yes stop_codon:yes gene_type:complete